VEANRVVAEAERVAVNQVARDTIHAKALDMCEEDRQKLTGHLERLKDYLGNLPQKNGMTTETINKLLGIGVVGNGDGVENSGLFTAVSDLVTGSNTSDAK
jgi:hypothetical protein